jgi:hypothetical protein
LLPRFLLFNITEPKPKRVEAARRVNDVPEQLAESCRSLATAGRGRGNLTMIELGGGVKHTAQTVQYSDDAADALDRFQAFVEEKLSAATPSSAPILNRTVEQATRAALGR